MIIDSLNFDANDTNPEGADPVVDLMEACEMRSSYGDELFLLAEDEVVSDAWTHLAFNAYAREG